MKRIPLIVAAAGLVVAGCTETTRLTKPSLALSAQPALTLSPRVAFTIVDDEAAGRGAAYRDELAKTICAAYPGTFAYHPSTEFPVPGKAALTLNIRQLGSYFNRSPASRLRRPVAHPASIKTDFEDWSTVIRSATTGEPLIKGQVGGWLLLPGLYHGWSGIAHIDREIHDNRPGHSFQAAFSIAAERSAPNSLGFITASMTADDAWREIAPAIGRLFAATAEKIRKDQSRNGTVPVQLTDSCMNAG